MPETYRVTMETQLGGLLPRDRAVNVLHFRHSLGGLIGTDLGSFATNVMDAYDGSWVQTGAVWSRTVKIYRIEGAPPHFPEATLTRGQAAVAADADFPHEIALCLSFKGGPEAHQRGRIYLSPATSQTWRASTTMAARPAANIRQSALLLGQALADAGGADWAWVVHSRTRGTDTTVSSCWVDDEWDTQRRRGLKPTVRDTRSTGS